MSAIGILLDMNKTTCKRLAISYLNASRSARGYRYTDREEGKVWEVKADTLVTLGRLLASTSSDTDRDDSDSEASAFDRWCRITKAVEVRA